MSKKAMHLFNLDIGSRNHKVFKSKHVFERREGSKFVRDEFFNKERYEAVIRMAFKHGLSSFRNKGPVAITFMDYKNTTHAVLVKISDDAVFVITMYSNNRLTGYQHHFIKEKNRINLWHHYRLPHMSNAERRRKDVDVYMNSVEDDNEMFRNMMNNVKKI